MDAAWGIRLTVYILLVQAAIWALIFWRMARQARALAEQIHRSGEALVIGPERANYQGWVKRFGIARTIGTLALTDRRILFKRPMGSDIVIPLSEIENVSDTVTFHKLYHSDGNYVSLNLRDGAEVVFMVRDQARWLSELRGRLGPVAGEIRR